MVRRWFTCENEGVALFIEQYLKRLPWSTSKNQFHFYWRDSYDKKMKKIVTWGLKSQKFNIYFTCNPLEPFISGVSASKYSVQWFKCIFVILSTFLFLSFVLHVGGTTRNTKWCCCSATTITVKKLLSSSIFSRLWDTIFRRYVLRPSNKTSSSTSQEQVM